MGLVKWRSLVLTGEAPVLQEEQRREWDGWSSESRSAFDGTLFVETWVCMGTRESIMLRMI